MKTASEPRKDLQGSRMRVGIRRRSSTEARRMVDGWPRTRPSSSAPSSKGWPSSGPGVDWDAVVAAKLFMEQKDFDRRMAGQPMPTLPSTCPVAPRPKESRPLCQSRTAPTSEESFADLHVRQVVAPNLFRFVPLVKKSRFVVAGVLRIQNSPEEEPSLRLPHQQVFHATP